jgi:hypothetical protein
MPTDTPDYSPDAWITAAEAANIEGVTTRAIQRRAAAGKYEAKRVETQAGEQWLINAATLKGAPTLPTDTPDESRDPTPDKSDQTPDSDRDRRDVERLEKEVSFLRGLVEQRDRDAAEMRAALREALRVMPKQLGQGTPPETPTQPDQAPTDSKPVKTPSNARKREARPFWRVFLGIR